MISSYLKQTRSGHAIKSSQFTIFSYIYEKIFKLVVLRPPHTVPLAKCQICLLVRDEFVDNVNPLALFEQNVFSTGYVTLIPKEPN